MGSFGHRVLTMAAILGAASLGTVGVAAAQESTPMAGMEMAAAAFPNHLHEGTCDNLNPEPKVPLADLAFQSMGDTGMGGTATPGAGMGDMATPMAGMATGMMGGNIPVAVATTEVALPLDAIVAGGHALNVHDSEDIGVYIACGNVAGTPDENGNLFIGLGELDGSGYHGVAWFLGEGDQTTVTVFLTQDAGMMTGGDADVDEEGNMMATPSA
jgi:hypothetical protein